jgi:periodic tryptophan protein 2
VITHGKKLQIWRTPGFEVEFAPFILHREIAGPYDDIISLQWSPDSQFILAGCKDMTIRVFSTDPVDGFEPSILTGHKDVINGAWFSVDAQAIYSVSRDGTLIVWKLKTLGNDFEEDEEIESDDDDELRDPKRSANTRRKRQRKTDLETGAPIKKWYLTARHFFKQNHAKVVSAAFHASSNLLVVGFNSGIFGIWELPDFTNIHTLR